MAVTDESARYWEVLTESLNRFSAREYLRVGGKIQPAGFQLSSSALNVVEREAAESQADVQKEIETLRNLYQGKALMTLGGSPALRAAYTAITAEQPRFLELRHHWLAARILLENLQRLPAANAASAEANARAELRNRVRAIVTKLHYVGWPLSGPSTTLAAHLLNGATLHAVESMDAYELATMLLARADETAEELLGEICVASDSTPPL